MSIKRFAMLSALLLVLGLPTASFAQQKSESDAVAGELVDRIVATVDDTPISASEVAFEGAVRAHILASQRKPDFGRLLTEPGEALEAVIFRLILLQQPATSDIKVADQSMAEERTRLLGEVFKSPQEFAAFLRRWGMTRKDLVRYFHTYVRLDTVIELSVDPKISDEEERSYYERNRDLVFGGKEFTEVADLVSRQLYLLKFEVEYNAWRSRLRSRANKRYIGR